MTPQEADTFYGEQADLFLSGAADLTRRGEHVSAQQNYLVASDAQMVQALLRWRHRLGGVADSLRNAVSTADRAADAAEANPTAVPHGSHYAGIDIVACLLGLPEIRAARLLTDGWPPPKGVAVLIPQLDVGLAHFLRSAAPPLGWQEALGRVSKKHRLVTDTFATYGTLLAGSTPSATDVARAVQFYYKRGDGWGDMNGGGLANPNCVDFRLAAILQTVKAPPSLTTVARPHVWDTPAGRGSAV
jgi:hypothetical protein